nr:hypothetical protein [Tanacetum cinerariifolium]
MFTSNQQTLANSGANKRPSMLEKGNYIPWESRFRRFLDNKLEDRERMWNSIQNGPYVRPMIPNPDDTTKQVLEPLSKMIAGNKSQYIVDVKVMNYLLQAIPNDIYNSVDACKNAKEMWERIKRLMFGSDVTSHVRHSRLMGEFDKFAAKKEESLESVYERLTTLVNIMDHNNVRLIPVSINTKFLNFVDYEHEYQGELHGDSQEDKLTTAMILLAQAITQKFFAPTNNRLRTSSNTRNQAVIQDGRVDIQTKNEGYGGNGNKNARRQNSSQAFNAGTENDERNHIVQPGSNLNNEENDFLLDNLYGEKTMEELTVAVMLMDRIQPADGNAETVPSYDVKAVREVNASYKVYEQVSHVKCKTIIQTSDDDQIDSNIIFDDPYVENNGSTSDHDSNAQDEYHEIQMLAYNV